MLENNLPCFYSLLKCVCGSHLFQCLISEVLGDVFVTRNRPQELNSCLYKLAYGKLLSQYPEPIDGVKRELTAIYWEPALSALVVSRSIFALVGLVCQPQEDDWGQGRWVLLNETHKEAVTVFFILCEYGLQIQLLVQHLYPGHLLSLLLHNSPARSGTALERPVADTEPPASSIYRPGCQYQSYLSHESPKKSR